MKRAPQGGCLSEEGEEFTTPWKTAEARITFLSLKLQNNVPILLSTAHTFIKGFRDNLGNSLHKKQHWMAISQYLKYFFKINQAARYYKLSYSMQYSPLWFNSNWQHSASDTANTNLGPEKAKYTK